MDHPLTPTKTPKLQGSAQCVRMDRLYLQWNGWIYAESDTTNCQLFFFIILQFNYSLSCTTNAIWSIAVRYHSSTSTSSTSPVSGKQYKQYLKPTLPVIMLVETFDISQDTLTFPYLNSVFVICRNVKISTDIVAGNNNLRYFYQPLHSPHLRHTKLPLP